MPPTGRSRRRTRREIAALLADREMAVADLARALGREQGSLSAAIRGMVENEQADFLEGHERQTVALTDLGRADLLEEAERRPGVIEAGDLLLLLMDNGRGVPPTARALIAAETALTWSARMQGPAAALLVFRSHDAESGALLQEALGELDLLVYRLQINAPKGRAAALEGGVRPMLPAP